MGCGNTKAIDNVESVDRKIDKNRSGSSKDRKPGKTSSKQTKESNNKSKRIENDVLREKKDIMEEEEEEEEKKKVSRMEENMEVREFEEIEDEDDFDHSSITVPQTQEGFDAELFGKVLYKFPKIKSIEFSQPGTTTIMADTRHVEIKYEEYTKKHPTKVVVKFSGPNSKRNTAYNNFRGLLDYNEYRFYDQILGRNFKTPKVYFSHVDVDQVKDEGGEGILHRTLLILQDLEGDEIDCREKFVGKECAKDVIHGISKIHSEFWHANNTSREMVGIFKGNRDPYLKQRDLDWVMECFGFQFHFHTSSLKLMDKSDFENHAAYNEENLEKFVEFFGKCWEKNKKILEEEVIPDLTPEEEKEDFKKTVESMYKADIKDLVKTSTVRNTLYHDQTICHCDYRLDNMCVGKDKLLGIFDWATGTLGNGVYDVSSFLLRNLRTKDVVAHEDELVEFYAECLDKDPKTIREMYKDALGWELCKATVWLEAFMMCKNIDQMKIMYEKHYTVFINQLKNIFRSFCKYHELQ